MVNFVAIAQISLFPVLGFVFAAVLSHAVSILYGDKNLYHYRFENRFAVLTSFCIAMFAGPYLTTRHALDRFGDGSVGFGKLAAMVLIVGSWSFCAGIMVAQWLMVMGVLNLQ